MLFTAGEEDINDIKHNNSTCVVTIYFTVIY